MWLFFIFINLYLLVGCNPYLNRAKAEASIKLGVAFLRQGYLKNAKQEFLSAQKLNPADPAAWYGMAYLNEILGELSEAEKYYKHAINVSPQDGPAHNNYGVFLYKEKCCDLALKHFLLAIKDPAYLDTAATYENMGLCALKMLNKQLADEYFHKALQYK
jgi:type IV pilus assembly protein PilF